MSDISISNNTIQAMGMDNLLSGSESTLETTSEVSSGMNEGGVDAMEQTVAGTEIRSKTQEFFGNGPDFSSTGTDVDIKHTMSSILDSAMGSIANEIA